jgi:hypothetical protein
MNVLVTFNDGNTINPVFEPTTRNLQLVKDFYLDLLDKNEIYHFSITYDNGDVFAQGRL